MSTTMMLESAHLRMAVNAQGQITQLFNLGTGTELLATRQPTGWRLITTLGEWQDHAVDDAANSGQISVIPQGLQIHFSKLTGITGVALPIELTLTFSLEDEGREVAATAQLVNHSAETIREVWFPFVSGFQRLSANGDDHLTMPLQMGQLIHNPVAQLPRRTHSRFSPPPGGFYAASGFRSHMPPVYPGVASMSWMDWFNAQQGFYLGLHTPDFRNTALLARGRDEDLGFQLGFARYPFVKPGEVWNSPAYVLRPHGGDWHAGARRYQQYAQTWMRPLRRPAWLDRAVGIHGLVMKHQNKHVYRSYASLVDIFRENKAQGLDLILLLFAWFQGGHDSGYPEYVADPAMGGEEGLRAAMKTIQSEGGRVVLYTQGNMMDQGAAYFQTGPGRAACLKNAEGVPYFEDWSLLEEGTVYPNKLFALGCHATAEWRRRLEQQVDLVADLGADGVLFDQMGATSAHLCFDPGHPHRPDEAYAAKAALVAHLQAYAERRNPQFGVVTEQVCDAYICNFDFTHGMGTVPDAPQARQNTFPDLYRYTFPDHRITSRMTAFVPQFNYLFAAGQLVEFVEQEERWCRIEAPAKEHLFALIRLRKRLENFMVLGRYLDTEGFVLQGEGVQARAIQSADGRSLAIPLWNNTEKPLPALVTVAREADTWMVFHPAQPDEVGCTPKDQPILVTVPAQQACVLVVPMVAG